MEYKNLIINYPHLYPNTGEAPFTFITDISQISKWNSNYINRANYYSETPFIGILSNDPYYLIVRDLLRFPNGELKGVVRIINKSELEKFHGVVIAPFYQGKLLLLRIFRSAIHEWQLEFPRGFGEFGATPEQQARNEISEEINGKISKLEFLGEMHSNSGLEYSKTYLFKADITSYGFGQEEEGIKEIVLMEPIDFRKRVNQGEIKDGFTLAAYSKIL